MAFLVFDIGGTWLKCAAWEAQEFPALTASPEQLAERMVRSPSPRESDSFAPALRELARQTAGARPVEAAVISTAGILHPSGRRVVACADHLGFLRSAGWIETLERAFSAPVRLLNDAEAFLLGAAETGSVPRVGTLCALVIGTGLGCAVSKDGRHWRPQGKPSLLGSIRCGEGATYDSLASASRLAAKDRDHDLVRTLTAPEHEAVRTRYFATLADLAATAGILHDADEILLGGGLVDAAQAAGLDLAETVAGYWKAPPPETGRWPRLRAAPQGNALTLLGAAALALTLPGIEAPEQCEGLPTEAVASGTSGLHRESSREIIEKILQAEAGAGLDTAIAPLAELAEQIVGNWESGGRLLYVGAGTSGRIAALDAVEIPCTFGCPPDRVAAVIAGGLAESALRIESEGEEDFTAAPDMLLLQPGPRDTVVGISASGSAVYVRTALACARSRGAATALVTASTADFPWDWVVRLGSGAEVVAGSTRMKAGTATKKVLNALSTTVMARTGKLRGPHMIDMACLNAKLVERAVRILRDLFSLSDPEARRLLAQHDHHLRRAIEAAEHS